MENCRSISLQALVRFILPITQNAEIIFDEIQQDPLTMRFWQRTDKALTSRLEVIKYSLSKCQIVDMSLTFEQMLQASINKMDEKHYEARDKALQGT